MYLHVLNSLGMIGPCEVNFDRNGPYNGKTMKRQLSIYRPQSSKNIKNAYL